MNEDRHISVTLKKLNFDKKKQEFRDQNKHLQKYFSLSDKAAILKSDLRNEKTFVDKLNKYRFKKNQTQNLSFSPNNSISIKEALEKQKEQNRNRLWESVLWSTRDMLSSSSSFYDMNRISTRHSSRKLQRYESIKLNRGKTLRSSSFNIWKSNKVSSLFENSHEDSSESESIYSAYSKSNRSNIGLQDSAIKISSENVMPKI